MLSPSSGWITGASAASAASGASTAGKGSRSTASGSMAPVFMPL
jgi:hypothetical protein